MRRSNSPYPEARTRDSLSPAKVRLNLLNGAGQHLLDVPEIPGGAPLGKLEDELFRLIQHLPEIPILGKAQTGDDSPRPDKATAKSLFPNDPGMIGGIGGGGNAIHHGGDKGLPPPRSLQALG